MPPNKEQKAIPGLGKRLLQFRDENYLKAQDFAEALGVLPSSLKAYYHDQSVPGGKLLQRLHEIGCDINWLLTGEKTKPAIIQIANTKQQRMKCK